MRNTPTLRGSGCMAVLVGMKQLGVQQGAPTACYLLGQELFEPGAVLLGQGRIRGPHASQVVPQLSVSKRRGKPPLTVGFASTHPF